MSVRALGSDPPALLFQFKAIVNSGALTGPATRPTLDGRAERSQRVTVNLSRCPGPYSGHPSDPEAVIMRPFQIEVNGTVCLKKKTAEGLTQKG